MRGRAGGAWAALVLAALVAGCGGDASGAGRPDPVARAEDPATVLMNSQYPELPVEGLRTSYLLDTGEHLTHVLSFVDGLRLDENAATEALRHFEHLRRQVQVEVRSDAEHEGGTLLYNVRPRNYPQRYVVIVPDGAPLPRWAGRREEGRSFASTRPVNVDHAVTVIRLASEPFVLGPPFDTMAPVAQLDTVFLVAACARSAAITTDEDAAYRYGANIHNIGEGVICSNESRQLAGRQLGLPATAMADALTASQMSPAGSRRPALAAPAFDRVAYEELPRLPRLFALG